jgi:hypothetical protein
MNTRTRVLVSAAAAVFAYVAMADFLGSSTIAAVAAVIVMFATWSMTDTESVPASGTAKAESDITPITPHYGDSA